MKSVQVFSGSLSGAGNADVDVRLDTYPGRTHAIQFVFAGTLTATASVFVSNDGATWTDFSTQVTFVNPPAGAGGSGGVNFSFVGFEYVRVRLAWVSGSSTIVARLHAVR